MKKYCIIFLLSIIISVTVVSFSGISQNEGTMSVTNMGQAVENEAYLRIHIRADSNENAAQAVKYRVKERVVEYLTPLVAEYPTKEAAMQGLSKELHRLSAVAEGVLREEGFSYGASAELKRESFPTRIYGEYTLPAGEYAALIITLGKGEGDNWWCVVYPPLCFAATDANVIYKSKILEIIQEFQKNKK
jgi:stage II sporulation protein R